MKLKHYTLALAASLLVTGTAVAFDDYDYVYTKETVQPAKWWANLSAGRGMTNHHPHHKSSGISSILSFNGAFTDSIYGTLYGHNISANDDEARDSGVMVGYRWSKPKGYYGISTGLGYMSKYSSYQYSNYGVSYYGKRREGGVVPIQLQAFWTPFKHVGFGITTHGAFGKENYGSIQFGIQAYA